MNRSFGSSRKDFVVERSHFVLPGSKNSFRGRHFKKRYASIRFPKIFSIRLRVPLILSNLEDAINDQINIEYNISYIYHSMYAFFSRDNVALDGFAQYFKKESLEERSHAELLMDYQTKRGGKVSLQAIMPPQLEFEHAQKGCGLYALELALSLEKLNYDKLLYLHEVADECGDAAACDFIEGELLESQVDSVKESAALVATLTRMGADGPYGGLATWHFDKNLQN